MAKNNEGGVQNTSPSEFRKPGIYFKGFHNEPRKEFPAWRYHECLPPRLVNNTEEDQQASDAGWKQINVPVNISPPLVNWRWDLEEFTAEQMVLFAKDEFEVELPVEAGREKLFKAIWELSMAAPQNKDRIVFIAHTINMEYDQTLKQIRKAVKNASELITEEFYA